MCALWRGGSQNCNRLTHQKIRDVCWGWVLWKQNQARESVVIHSCKGEARSKNSVMFKGLLAWGQCDPLNAAVCQWSWQLNTFSNTDILP